MEHLDDILRVLNQKPKKLTQLNDITRLKDIYAHKLPNSQTPYARHFRQTITITKFRNIDMQAALDQHCSYNAFGRVTLTKVQPNRALKLARELKLMVTLKRVPPVESFEHADESRY